MPAPEARVELGRTRSTAVGGPEFTDDLFSRNPLAVCNLLTAYANCGLEASPVFWIDLVVIVGLLDEF